MISIWEQLIWSGLWPIDLFPSLACTSALYGPNVDITYATLYGSYPYHILIMLSLTLSVRVLTSSHHQKSYRLLTAIFLNSMHMLARNSLSRICVFFWFMKRTNSMKHRHGHRTRHGHGHVNTYNVQNIKRSMGVVSVSDTDTYACQTPDTAREWSVHAS